MRKWMKRTLVGAAIFLVVVLLAGIAVGNFMYNLALNPDSDKSMVFGAAHNDMERSGERPKRAEEIWFEEVGYADWTLLSHDGLRLHAYAVENPAAVNHRWVILCHGYGGEGTDMLFAANRFWDRGYSVLMPDARAAGASEGDTIGMGWPERRDMVQWTDTIVSADPEAQIVLFGVSMGGATVMMTAGEALADNVKAIVEDCGYTSVWDEFAYQLDQLFGLPAFPVLHFASLVTRVRAGYWLGEASAIKQMAKAEKPILFIHGGNDTFVPTDMVYRVYEAAPEPKALYVVEGAGHGGASSVAGEAYWDTLWAFVEGYVE